VCVSWLTVLRLQGRAGLQVFCGWGCVCEEGVCEEGSISSRGRMFWRCRGVRCLLSACVFSGGGGGGGGGGGQGPGPLTAMFWHGALSWF
jgi:hypothetical protein